MQDGARIASLTPEVFADAMAELASGVAVITARRSDGQPFGLTVISIASYSADPPSVIFAIDHEARSHPPLLEAAEHGVHLLAAGQEGIARAFAGKGDAKFAGLDWEWDGEVPAIAGVLAYLRCRRTGAYGHGDHSILVGEALEVRVGAGEPLLYLRRRLGWGLSEPGPAA